MMLDDRTAVKCDDEVEERGIIGLSVSSVCNMILKYFYIYQGRI